MKPTYTIMINSSKYFLVKIYTIYVVLARVNTLGTRLPSYTSFQLYSFSIINFVIYYMYAIQRDKLQREHVKLAQLIIIIKVMYKRRIQN